MEFLDEFNKVTNNKFEYIRVAAVEIQKKPPMISVNLLLPYDVLDTLSDEDKQEIREGVEAVLPKSMQIVVSLSKSYINKEIVVRYMMSYFKEKHPTVTIEENDIDVQITNGVAFVKINLVSMFYDYFKSMDLAASIDNYMSHKMCNKIVVEICDSKKDIDLDADLATEDSITIISRRIRTEDHQKIVGKAIGVRPRYICDSKETEEAAVYCGEVVDFKRNASKKTGNSYYIFKIDDTTGTMVCKAFAKYQGEGEYDAIGIGDELIISGKIELDTYLHDSVLLCRDVSKCVIDKSSIILKEELKDVPSKYVAVHPQPYVDYVQDDLFNTGAVAAVPKNLQGKSFVVFDVETTGLDVSDEVIELGAVKVTDGVICQTFSTFVNPHIAIPDKITELTSITDADVMNAPDMSDVIADFYKFSENCVLVAHNASFDKKFIDKYAKANGYMFTNRVMDTLEMARKSVVCKNYKLGTLCEYFDISLEGAHRAVNDCAATAKLFIELSKLS